MSPNYDSAEAAWREAWRLARKAEAAAAGTAEQAADAAFGLALSHMLEALGHPRAIRRAQLTDECVASVDRIAMAHRATLATPEGSPERDQANAETIAAYVELGRSMSIERMIEERVIHHVSEIVPEDAAERATYFQEAAARVLYDFGGLSPRILMTLAGHLGALPEGRLSALLQPKQHGRGKAGTTKLRASLQQDIALRILMDSRLANQAAPEWIEDTQPGVTRWSYERWLAAAESAAQASVKALTDKLMRQEPLTAAERELQDRLNHRTLKKMIEGLAALP